jgi:hypothetical protein
MNMTPAEKEEIQEKLLAMGNAASRLGLSEERLLRGVQRYGFPEVTLVELRAELHHLEKAGLMTTVEKALRPDLLRWKSTADGDRWLMMQGLI